MKVLRKNPIRHTVAHFIEAGVLRRYWRKASKIKKSNFVRFMESIENRGPLTMHEDFYKKWTVAVRRQMEDEGLWLEPMDEVCTDFIAEYLHRLLIEFWEEHPDVSTTERFDLWSHFDKMRPTRLILKKIYLKIRNKGIRDKTFYLDPWSLDTPQGFALRRSQYGNEGIYYFIRPYEIFQKKRDQ